MKRHLAFRSLLSTIALLAPVVRADDWPQWLGPQRDGIWREEGILERFPEGGPKLRWKQDIGPGYAGPAVADGHVYIFDRQPADAGAAGGPGRPGKERLLCLDEADGNVLWEFSYDCPYNLDYGAGPRVTPTVAGKRVYSLGAEGHLHCLRAADGKVLWKQDFKARYGVDTPGWGFAAAPLLYKGLVICLARGEGSTVVAFDAESGEERWRALSAKEPGYCPPTLITQGGVQRLLVWHPEAINGLDPETGEVLWSIPWKIRSGLSIPTPQQDGRHLFLMSFYNGSTLLRLPETASAKPMVVWQTERESEQRTEHLNGIMNTPVISNGHVYAACSYGQFRCLRLEDGERLWEDFRPVRGEEVRWGTVFVTPHEDRFFLFNEKGELIIANLSPSGYEELDRVHLIEPDGSDMRQRPIVWSHPAYANRSIYVRNDSEIRCFSLAGEG